MFSNDVTEALIIGLVTVILVVLCWLIWAYFIYRTSDDRFKLIIKHLFTKYDKNAPTDEESKKFILNVSDLKFDTARTSGDSRTSGNVTAQISFEQLPGTTEAPPRGPYTRTYSINDDDGIFGQNIII